jgi:hypothetical protein
LIWHKEVGNGPTKVVVIHGWFWDHRVFTPLFDVLDIREVPLASHSDNRPLARNNFEMNSESDYSRKIDNPETTGTSPY